MSPPLLSVRDLCIGVGSPAGPVEVVQHVAFEVAEAEAVGVVGESGSGKSLSMLAVLRLLPPGATLRGGEIRYAGRDLLALSPLELRCIRGREIAVVFQDPSAALNPVLTVGRQIAEVRRRHFRESPTAAMRKAADLLAEVGVPDPALRLQQFPHEFSGGMRQRATIAMALAGEPRLLIADEPTTALDVTVQAEIVALVKRLQRARGMALVWVTHDLALLARIADRVVVMRAGQVVETAAVDQLFAAPSADYTRRLLASIPRIDEPRPPAEARHAS